MASTERIIGRMVAAGACAALSAGEVTAAAHVQAGGGLPPQECNLTLAPPVVDWHEALPLGNGQLGALIWGGSNRLTVKLDRVDVWDERGHPLWRTDEFTWKTIQRYRAAGNFARIHEIFDNHYSGKPPTHVAMGKLELVLPEGAVAKTFRLDLATAEAQVEYTNGTAVTAFVSAAEPVVMVTIPGPLAGYDLWAPGMGGTWVPALGYPAPVMGRDEDGRWYVQSVPEGPMFAVFAKLARVGGDTVLAITIATSTKDGADPLAAARRKADQALRTGCEALRAAHRKYWAGFWGTSSVRIPDAPVLQHYYLTRYYFGSNSRPGSPAMGTLQGIWTDDKQLPSFKNNLHNDLETQVQYQAYQAAGNFAEGAALFDYLWDLLPVFRQFAKNFYETQGAAVPGVMTWGGHPTTGWPQYALSPTQAGWLGWLFYQHWRYTQDRTFLATRAYPWCAEIAECWAGLLVPDGNGVLKLPLSSSAEVFDNTPRSWMKPNSNYDRDLMQAHLLGLAEMADALGRTAEGPRWRTMAGQLGPRHVDEEGALMWSEDEKVTFLHRHLSHSMSIHPFNLLTIDGSERDRAIIAATMKRYDQLGPDVDFAGDWAGWSFPWMASVRARVGQAEEAYRHLTLFVEGWISRNGFHMNRNQGTTKAKGHGFFLTLEANIEATQAVHDMLLQSWAPTIGRGEAGIVRLFPATPRQWHEAEFTDLRAEGGFRVSARRRHNATAWFKITAEADGLLRLRDNFDGRTPAWAGAPMEKKGGHFEKAMRRGESVEASLEPAALGWDEAVADPTAAHLPRPTKVQYDWQEQELAMFVQLDPATIQQREYDDGSTPMSDIRFEKLDVDEWCRAAKAFGAKEIVFMLAHSGGFCMWPSGTTGYHIGNTPYKGGHGDVVKEFAQACREHGLNMGFYLWSPHPPEVTKEYGFQTAGYKFTPVKDMKESNEVLNRRLREIHERLGGDKVTEVWFDLPRYVSAGQTMRELFSNAVVLAVGCRDPWPTIRWPGTESGTVSYPCWSTLSRTNLDSSLYPPRADNDRQSQKVDNPDGDYWIPNEADVPLHNHFWHMRPEALKHRRSVDELMNCYEKSVGRNSFLILNCAPQADGSVHPDDMKCYEEFGAEIQRRFGHPLAVREQIAGREVELDLGGSQEIRHVDLWEDYRCGHRIREFVVEGFDGANWMKLASGTAVGRRFLWPVEKAMVSKVRVRVTKSVGTPLIRKFQVHGGATETDR